MKKVIEGKLYNTETAEKIAEANNGYTLNDFNYYSEKLYRTKKGAWFLHVSGGANSTVASRYGNSSSWGEDIKVLKSEADVYFWLEKNNEVDLIEKYFPNEIEEA